MNLIQKNVEKINKLCDEHHVKSLEVFGSLLTDQFNDSSDIDLVVEFKQIDLASYANNYFSLKEALEEALNRQVDLLEKQAIRNPYLRRSIEQSKGLIYG